MTYDLNLMASITGALAAFASFFVSYLTYRQDQPRLDFACYVGAFWGAGSDGTDKTVYFKIVNSGRRPVTLGTIGGDFFWFQPKILWTLFPKIFKPRSFILDGKTRQFLTKSGTAITLKEGEEVSFMFDLPLHNDLLQAIAKSDVKRFYIWDNLNNKHCLNWANLRKLKTDASDLLAKTKNGNS